MSEESYRNLPVQIVEPVLAAHHKPTQLEEMAVTLTTILRGMWRYRWPSLLAAWVVCLIGWAYVYYMPNIFQAKTRIYVDAQSMVKRVVGDLTVPADTMMEIRVLTKAMLSRPQLEKTAHDAGLALAARTPREQEQILDRLRENIVISKESDNIYSISYKNTDRDTAQKVVSTVLNNFVEDALGERHTDAGTAQAFLEKQIKEYEGRLNKAEERLAAFKQKNVGLLPGEHGDYYTRLQKSMSDLENTREQVRLAAERRDEYKKQLAGEIPVFGIDAQPASAQSGAASDVDALITQYDEQLQTLLLKYTDNYPDVVALKETIARLKKRRKKELANAPRGAAPALALDANPVYQQLKMGMSEAEVDLATLQTKMTSQEADVKKLRNLVNTIPEVERELKALNRDYDVTRQQFEILLKRREALHLTHEVATSGDQLQFRIIDPPRAALTPVGPDRPMFLTMVAVLAVGIGIGLAFVIQQLNPVFNSRRELREATGLPVLGTVSLALRAEARTAFKRKTIAFSVTCAALPLALGLAVLLEHPARHLIGDLLGAI